MSARSSAELKRAAPAGPCDQNGSEMGQMWQYIHVSHTKRMRQASKEVVIRATYSLTRKLSHCEGPEEKEEQAQVEPPQSECQQALSGQALELLGQDQVEDTQES
ncbi:hypothetical protein NDU88_007049 [Pleurodeles waltl]|uniref:Uncharacterized protein n=1 Tax=Pleurodeles waltl TaxID=8319 RepID=A0AAV7UP06_PLEWA|nr:hypothetical protein NDU88_007049 [Pleurodeles waltl]